MGRAKKSSANCYCAFCRSPRRIVRRRHLGFSHLLASVPVAGLIMWLMWAEPDPRVLVVYVVLLALVETFMQLRWRLLIVCRDCGFDPILYLRSPNAAADKVKAHLERRREDPRALLSRPLNLPALPAERAEEIRRSQVPVATEESKGRLLSKSL